MHNRLQPDASQMHYSDKNCDLKFIGFAVLVCGAAQSVQNLVIIYQYGCMMMMIIVIVIRILNII